MKNLLVVSLTFSLELPLEFGEKIKTKQKARGDVSNQFSQLRANILTCTGYMTTG